MFGILGEESSSSRWEWKAFPTLDRRRFGSSRESEEGESGEKGGGGQILRRKSFFDDRRKSLFAKKEKLTLNGEEDEDEEVYLGARLNAQISSRNTGVSAALSMFDTCWKLTVVSGKSHGRTIALSMFRALP